MRVNGSKLYGLVKPADYLLCSHGLTQIRNPAISTSNLELVPDLVKRKGNTDLETSSRELSSPQ